MTEEKGLDPAVADKIGVYVQLKGAPLPLLICSELIAFVPGGPELIDKLAQDSAIVANASAKQGLEEMRTLVSLLQAYKITDKVTFRQPSQIIALMTDSN
jgi:histidyl-tRNA synthetase